MPETYTVTANTAVWTLPSPFWRHRRLSALSGTSAGAVERAYLQPPAALHVGGLLLGGGQVLDGLRLRVLVFLTIGHLIGSLLAVGPWWRAMSRLRRMPWRILASQLNPDTQVLVDHRPTAAMVRQQISQNIQPGFNRAMCSVSGPETTRQN